jgi:DNA polymerase V
VALAKAPPVATYRTSGYHKAGVMLANIVPEGNRQFTLLEASESARPARLMEVLEGINERYGRGTLRLATVRAV